MPMKMPKPLKDFERDMSGASAVEKALFMAGAAALILLIVLIINYATA